MTALACTALSRHFGAVRAVDGVDLTVSEGERHAVIGPNGAGKSTLFRLLSGGLRPSTGRILLDGRNISDTSEARRARLGIAQTFQHSHLFLSMSAAENVRLAVQRQLGRPWWPLPRSSPAIDVRVVALLGEVGLGDRAGLPVAALSHGERRRLELAVALALEPRVLLLDEPAAGLSLAESEGLVNTIERLPRSVALLFVEHDLDLVFRVATRVTVMHLGAVLMTGTPEQVRASAEVQAAYLGSGTRESLFSGQEAASP